MENIKTLGFCDLDDHELQNTNGGIAPLVLIGGAAAVLGLAWVSYQVGTAIGKFIYYVFG